MVILVGILCPLPMNTSLRLLKLARDFVRKGGIVVYSTNQVIMVEKDPLADYLMRLSGWNMDYKTDEESRQLAEMAGWKFETQFFDDSMHFQCMTVARNQVC